MNTSNVANRCGLSAYCFVRQPNFNIDFVKVIMTGDGDANIGHVNLLRCPSPTTTTTSSSFEKQLRKFSTYKLVTVAVVFVVRFCFLSPCFDSPNAQLKISFIRASDEYQIKITKNVIHCILSKYRMTFQLEIFISQAIRSIKNLMYFPARCWVRRNACRSKDCLI